MPTIRGYTKGINNKELKRFINNYMARITTIAKNAGLEAMKELRESVVTKWYGGTPSSKAMNASTIYESKPSDIKQKKGKIEITVRSYIDSGIYESAIASFSPRKYTSVSRWKEKHEKPWQFYGKGEVYTPLKMDFTVGEFLFNLPWEEGMIGLPPKERYTGTKWVNPAKKIYNGNGNLDDYLNNQMREKWNSAVKKKFKNLMK